MRKTLQIAAILAVLVCSAFGQNALTGMTVFNPRGTHIQDSCFMVIRGAVQNDSTILEQSYQPSPSQPAAALPSQCSYFNFVFDSLFYNENVNNQLNYTASTDPNNFIINATLNAATLSALNGSACLLLPQTQYAGIDQYLCKMFYDTTPVYLAVWGSGQNFTFDTSRTNSSVFPLALEQQNDPTMQANWLGLNTTFPSIVVYLFDSCGSNSNITSLSNSVLVTTPENLTDVLPGLHLAYTVIKPLGSQNYSVVVSNSNATLFDTFSSSFCWSLGDLTYSNLVADMNYCGNGCQVSFVLMNARNSIYVLESTGLWTINGSSNGGNGNNNGNGTNNGTTNGTGNGNGNNNGGAASSALTMGINMVILLVVSAVYWL